MDRGALVEVLGEQPGPPVGARVVTWSRTHPVVAAALALLLLAGAVAVAVRVLRPPLPASVRVAAVDDATDVYPTDWDSGRSVRPSGPPTLPVTFTVEQVAPGRAVRGRPVTTAVVGITGPGVARTDLAATAVPLVGPVRISLRAVLDCPRLVRPVSGADYRLDLSARSGSRGGHGSATLGGLGRSLADEVQVACATWSARTDLTVTALSADADPVRPRISVRMTIANTGPKAAVVDRPGRAGLIRSVGPLPVTIPSGGIRDVDVSVRVDRCDSVDQPGVDGTSDVDRSSSLTSMIGVEGRAGPVPQAAAADPDRIVSTGVALAPAAHRTLAAALLKVCGGLHPPLVMIPPGSVRFNDRTRLVTVPVDVYLPPGRRVSVRLRTLHPGEVGQAPERSIFSPVWRSTRALVPDRTGKLSLTLVYRVAGPPGSCPTGAMFLPDLIATVDVPGAAGHRHAVYSPVLDVGQDPQAPRFCRPSH